MSKASFTRADARLLLGEHKDRQRFEAVNEMAGQFVVNMDDWTFVSCNELMLSMFGYESISGLHVNDLIPQELAKTHSGHLQRFKANPTPLQMAGRKVLGRRSDGSRVRVMIALKPAIIDGEPRTVGQIFEYPEV